MCVTTGVHGSVCLSNRCGQVGDGLENKSFVKDPAAISATFQGVADLDEVLISG